MSEMCQSHKRVQGNGFDPQHGGAMTSMHKVYIVSWEPELENQKGAITIDFVQR